MKTKSCLKAVIFIASMIFCATVFSQDINENTAILERTKKYYNNGDFAKAATSINQAIDLKENQKAFPEDIRLMAQQCYLDWIEAISKRRSANNGRLNEKEFDNYVLQLKLHPQAASQQIFDKVELLFDKELQSLQDERQKVTNGNSSQWIKINDRIEALEQSQNELFDVVSGRVTVAQIKLQIAEIKMARQARALKIAIIVIGILLLSVLIILSIYVIKNYKRRIAAQKHFDTSMEVISSMGDDSDENTVSVATAGESSKLRNTVSAALLSKGDGDLTKSIMDFFAKPENRKMMAEVQNKCFALGDKIDKYTFRQRTSRKVSELVLKIANEAKLSHDVALVCYCAGMVYDAGFLSVPKTILTAEQLTMNERQKIREHVHNAADHLEFVPDAIRPIFLQAAEFHHENMDGKGYLTGLSGTKIPFIARVIRVCESYISLTSKRAYRGIMDADAALAELKSKDGIYDPKIISLLEKVI